MDLAVTGVVWEWRGPAPFHFVSVPPDQAEVIADVAADVTYGWGMIPVAGRVGATRFTTSLWPKDGAYVIPLKDAVRRAEHLGLGDMVTVHLHIAL
jgi:hypothetical protein